MALPDTFTRINDFQRLHISGDSISLWTDLYLTQKNGTFDVDYLPKFDSVHMDLGKRGCSYLGEQLLDTEIPKYKVHPKHRDIIDENIKPDYNVWIEGFLKNGKSELEISENEIQYVLTKKSK